MLDCSHKLRRKLQFGKTTDDNCNIAGSEGESGMGVGQSAVQSDDILNTTTTKVFTDKTAKHFSKLQQSTRFKLIYQQH